jgi:5-methylcytosine-specific restriction endonuclease McrA
MTYPRDITRRLGDDRRPVTPCGYRALDVDRCQDWTVSDEAAILNTAHYRRLRRAILDRDLGLCQIKGPKCTRFATEVDHIVARVDGGAVFDPANLRAACRKCNSSGGAAVAAARRARYRTGVADYLTRF